MTVFTLHLTDGRTERVTAQACERRGGSFVFTTTQSVMGRPREVVLRRLPAVEVARVEPGG